MNKIIVSLFLLLVLAGGGYWWWLQTQKVDEIVVPASWASVEGLLATVIKGEGIDKKHGLNITYKTSLPGDIEREIHTRKVDLGAYGVLSFARAKLEGKETKVLFPYYYNIYSLLVKKDSPFYKVEDLKGKKLAVQPKVTAAFTGPQMGLALKDISLEKDFEILFSDAIKVEPLLDSKQVDGAFFYETLASKMIATGKYREIFEVQDTWRKETGHTFPFLVFVAFDDWLKIHENVAKKTRDTYMDATNLIVKNPEVLEKYRGFLAENLKIQTDQEMTVLKERLPKALLTKWDENAKSDIKYILEKAKELGLLQDLPKDEIFYTYK